MTEDDTLDSGKDAPPSARSARLPEQIGRYRLLRKVGSGGMGEVFEAQQLEPLRRRVALKVIKRGMDTDMVVARFESERQALALMDHECIAKVFDAGATPDGRPYFVMEYVKGVPITNYAVGERLTTRRRLELFIRVCEGVQHAHQKGIIHRDIKPSNVLVTLREREPLPKIIDFGLAKATQYSLTERTLYTELGQLMGTPEYMSPEQAEMSGLDVDTRTDVYALGVLLYVLLVGELPFDPQEFRAAGFDEIRRKIREEDPVKPSTRLKTIIGNTELQGERVRPEQQALRRHLRGDLDWIVMKAIEKDRARRYDSASELADDIERHLRHEPVRAGPPSAGYRTRKFVRRHRAAVVAAAITLAALLMGAVGTTVGWLRALRAERTAQREAIAARQISDFLVRMFQLSNPDESVGNTITAREILDEGASRIESELGEQPLTQARLMHTMGTVYESLGLYDAARPLLATSLELRTSQGATPEDVAQSQAALGRVHRWQANYAAAEPLLLAALATQERELGFRHADVATSLYDLATLYSRLERHAEAESLFLRALSIREGILGARTPEVASVLNGLGIHHFRRGAYAEAEPLYLRALTILQAEFGPEHPRVAPVLNNLAVVYRRQAKYDAAVATYERAIPIYEKMLGVEHPRLAYALTNLALVYADLEMYEQAKATMQRAIDIGEKAFDLDHPDYARLLHSMAFVETERGDFAAAEPLSRRALNIRERALGSTHTQVAWNADELGRILHGLQRYDEAEHMLKRAYAIFDEQLGAESEGVAWALHDLAVLYRDTGDVATSEQHFQRALSTFEAALGAESPFVADCLDGYAALLQSQGRAAAADSLRVRATSIRDGSKAPID